MTPEEKDVEKAKEIIDYAIGGEKELYGPWDLLTKLFSDALTKARNEGIKYQKNKAKGLVEAIGHILSFEGCHCDEDKEPKDMSLCGYCHIQKILDQWEKDV